MTISNIHVKTLILRDFVGLITRGVGTVGAHAPEDFREGTFVHPRSKLVLCNYSISCTRSSKIVPTPLLITSVLFIKIQYHNHIYVCV